MVTGVATGRCNAVLVQENEVCDAAAEVVVEVVEGLILLTLDITEDLADETIVEDGEALATFEEVVAATDELVVDVATGVLLIITTVEAPFVADELHGVDCGMTPCKGIIMYCAPMSVI